jgi:hypothetical protein
MGERGDRRLGVRVRVLLFTITPFARDPESTSLPSVVLVVIIISSHLIPLSSVRSPLMSQSLNTKKEG